MLALSSIHPFKISFSYGQNENQKVHGKNWYKNENKIDIIVVLERLTGFFYLNTGNILREHALPTIFSHLEIQALSK
jgi:hypothetical protein